MSKISAGLLMYRVKDDKTEVLLVHPGGPFWQNKDVGVWSIPKGEVDEDESGDNLDGLLQVAQREFEEETGVKPAGSFDFIGTVEKPGKTVYVWSFLGDCDVAAVKSNMITIDWPPKSGKKLEIPEVDKARFFGLEEAKSKLVSYQVPIIDMFKARTFL